MTDKTVLDAHRERFIFPLVHHHADTRTPFPVATEAVRGDHLVTQCWNQQGISFTWSPFQTDEKFLFSQQPWEVNLQHYMD